MPEDDEDRHRRFERRSDDAEGIAGVIIKMYDNQAITNSRLLGIERSIKDLNMGFPNGDVNGHRLYHEALIKKEEEKAQAWRNIKEKTLGGLILLLLTGIGSWVIVHVKAIIGLLSK